MLGMLGYGLMFVIDVAMAGRLGETALAASALAANITYIPYVFGIGLVGAVTVYQSQENGAKAWVTTARATPAMRPSTVP